ncbi:MAG: COX15/CtaA family protein [Myxococcales bacterium]|nr:COX15/CtaA family protein [Myxococcales bacterium]
MDRAAESPSGHRSVVVWLALVYLSILVMLSLGGITRLTGSGLSMVEWHPLMGAIPPLGHDAWQEVFEKYQQSPQYKLVNHWMTLGDFQQIFLWEYLHRLWGRLVGVAYVVPWAVLLWRRRIRGRLAVRTFIPFVLGGLQGALGWYMVASGLVDVPAVSHYRLAAHLGLALVVACYVQWLALDLSAPPAPTAAPARRTLGVAAWATFALVALQVAYGAFMAGTRAGHLYSTFPTLNGDWFPPQAFAYEPWWRNVLESPFGIHFVHRTLGWLTAAAVLVFAAYAWRRATTPVGRFATRALVVLVVVQMTLGALTVVLHVPVWAAALHQLCGALLLSCALAAVHASRGAPRRAPAPVATEPSAA